MNAISLLKCTIVNKGPRREKHKNLPMQHAVVTEFVCNNSTNLENKTAVGPCIVYHGIVTIKYALYPLCFMTYSNRKRQPKYCLSSLIN